MTSEELADLLDEPETHRRIVGHRDVPYALGVTKAPSGAFAFLLRVPDPSGFPKRVTLHGHTVPVIVEGGFRAPVPMRSTS